MTLKEKIESTKDQALGKTKEKAGQATDDKTLEAKGKAQGLLGKAKEVATDLKEKVTESVEQAGHKK